MKQMIRKQMIEKRKSLTKQEKEKRDNHILKQIRLHKKYQEARTVALFYPMHAEINLLDLLNDHKVFLFPKVQKNDIVFYIYEKEMRFKKSAFGVYEPIDGVVYKQQIDIMLVPALAMDKQYNRIGYGKGFYDRYLRSNRPKYAMGVIYPFQCIDHIETTANDEKLDMYVRG